MPDETTILCFQHLLEKHGLAEKIFAQVNEMLAQRGLLLRRGTLVDATIITVPGSTKNKEGKRDEEMHQTQKTGRAMVLWHESTHGHGC